MKKKIIALSAALMLFAGVVSASSINGDYKGNPIVKIMSNGKQLETDEVPAVILDGHTVVPISTLRQLGASVTWDAYGYSVDVKLPSQQQITPSQSNSNVDLEKVIIGFNEKAPQYNASNVRMIFNNLGGFLSAEVKASGDFSLDTQNILLTSSFVANSPVIQMFIDVYQSDVLTGFYDIRRSNVESFINKELSADDFINTWKWNPSSVPTASPQPSIPQSETNGAGNGGYTLQSALIELGVPMGSIPTVEMKDVAIQLLEIRKTKKQSDYSVQDALVDLGIPQGSIPTVATLKQAVKLISLK